MASTYAQIWSGEWVDWTRDVDLACCHCALVHNIQTRIRGKKLQMRFVENRRATAALRRHNKIRVTKKRD